MKLAVVAVVLATTGLAHAEEPALASVGDANLEPTRPQRDVQVTLAIGGSINFGIGVEDVGGNGGSGSLRVARRMTPSWMATLEIAGAAVLHKIEADKSETYTNNSNGFMVGFQYYVNRAFWIRGASGIGGYVARQTRLDGMNAVDDTLFGLASLGGGGIEFVRRKHFAVGVELFVLNQINRLGAITSGAILLDVSVF